jgi:hypothetical protein
LNYSEPRYCVGDEGIWKFRQAEDVEWTCEAGIISLVARKKLEDVLVFAYNISSQNGDIIATDILQANLEKASPKFDQPWSSCYQWKFKSKADAEWTTIEGTVCPATWSNEHNSFVYSLRNKKGEIVATDILEQNLETDVS